MNRLAVLMFLVGLSGLSGACFADEPAFCKSMCTSEKNQCRATTIARDEKEGRSLADMPEKNQFARTAQVQMASSDAGSLQKSGYEHRRMAHASACEDAYQRCTRGCNAPGGNADSVGAVVSRHTKKGG
jgi:hypothetical protein